MESGKKLKDWLRIEIWKYLKILFLGTELATVPKQQENQKQQSSVTQTPLELLKKRFGPQKIIASSHN